MKKKDLEKRIDELVRRVTELEQKPQFVYIPQVPSVPYAPPPNDQVPYVPPTQQGPYYGNVICNSANESTQQELFGVK
jgi:hypothetical protein